VTARRRLARRLLGVGVPAEESPSTYWLLLGITAVLLLIGLVMVLSASSVQSLREHGTTWYYFLRQGMWVSLGAVVFLIASSIDYRSLRRVATPFLVLSVSLLVVVLMPRIGIRVNGARSWIGAGMFRMQPAEVAKLALLLFSADLLDRRSDKISDSSLTLRVPTSDCAEAMDALAPIGKVEHQSRKSEDVTTKVLDNDARVRAAERAIRQIEVLLGRADALRDIIAIESDLARRQADLDSLKSQQAWLEDQTSLSTINVQLSRPGEAPVDEARGFLAGIEDGWGAMVNATVVLLTILGAVLPFALLLALFGVPLWMVLRRRVSAASAPARSA